MTIAFIGLGSNLEQPQRQLSDAISAMHQHGDVTVCQCSSFYRSVPMGPADQPDYVNAVVKIDTSLPALALLDFTQSIENQQGRVRDQAQRWGARTLDLDIVLFGDQQIHTPRLTVPHYGLAEREFVLYPLSELDANLVLPDGRALKSLLSRCDKKGLSIVLSAADVWKSVAGSV
ncbi:2-amino-4-hydroxy-6-hydroxymethyldihydropteridine diphosphokinase [Lacimicrobium sp. SS2-24]|uniref:2-amino-4-hydroxy-6- hydroxymethyldihydropteridine diphosphokinase n=1 Tax=Lacimicrobium sp. SS2-24 TaxID=2005569 RepID=UPI000B4B8F52|nr:2-amino-4-hydroxy-6-hydroxymethyldihydropteridine diphosphokinase [Lacimicrobium sp. SS2-24]